MYQYKNLNQQGSRLFKISCVIGDSQLGWDFKDKLMDGISKVQ